jgi:hypothetical protein
MPRSLSPLEIAVGVGFLLIVALLIVAWKNSRSLRTRLTNADSFLCMGCQFPLNTLRHLVDDSGLIKCPECGRSQNFQMLPQIWHERMTPPKAQD